MVERNESRFQLKQDNKVYILSTSLINDKIKFVCTDSNSQIFDGEFTKNDLMNLSKYFQVTYDVAKIQKHINSIIEKQRISIGQRFSTLNLVLYLINNDKIIIPLNIKLTHFNQNYNNKNNNYISSEKIQSKNQINYYDITNNQNKFVVSNKQIDLVNKNADVFKNEEIRKIYLLEKENKNYKIQIQQLNIENEILKENNKRIKDLENSIKTKEEELTRKNTQISALNFRIQQLKNFLNNNKNKDKIIELMEKLELKEKEIKEIKSRYPLELSKGEKLMSIIFQSYDFKFTRSFLCKNTDQFTKLESLLYKEYPEYLENDAENYFLVNGRKIYRYKSLEENGIHNSDIIILNKIDN